MSAPKRIWACHASYDGRLIGMHDGEISGWDEYIRADLVQALVEALRVSDEFVRSLGYEGIGNITRAALRAIGEGGE